MAPPVTLPANFSQWDASGPPASLPANFSGWDGSKPIPPPAPAPPGNYITVAPEPSILDRLRGTVANSGVGYSLEQVLPKLADALNLHPTETVNSPTYQSDRQNFIAPQYLMPGNPQTQQGQKVKALLTGVGNITNPKVLATGAGIGAAAALAAPLAPVAIPAALAATGIGMGGLGALHHATQAQAQYNQGNVDAGNAATANIPTDLLMLLGSAGIKIPGEPTVPGQNYTPTHAAAFEGAVAPAAGMGKNFIPQNLSPEVLSPIRSTVANMAQGTPTEQGIANAVTDKSTPPLERLAAFQNVLKQSMGDLESVHAPALAQAKNVPVNVSPLIQGLQSQISPTMDPADVAAINNLISRTQNAKTIGDLGRFRQELNVENSPEYRQSQVQAGRSGLSSQALSGLTDAVRNSYYDNLQNATGTDFTPLKRQEANLFQVQEAVQNQVSPLAKAEATFNASSTFREKAGNLANIIKDPRSTVTQTVLRESPSTRLSTLIQKSLSNLPSAQQSSPAIPSIPPTQIGGGVSSPQIGAPPPNELVPSPQMPTTSTVPQGVRLTAPSAQPQLPSPSIARFLTESASPDNPQTPYPQLNPNAARTVVQPNPANPKLGNLGRRLIVGPDGTVEPEPYPLESPFQRITKQADAATAQRLKRGKK
jgi:hypothetical protein